MATYTPQELKVWNRLDDIGTMLDLQRNPGESNAAFRQRILHTYVERAGSGYNGLINGLNTEFGLDKFMTIDLTSTITNYDVYVTASRVVFVADSATEMYDYRSVLDSGYTHSASLGEICDLINTSSIWGASVDSTLEDIRCDCLMIQSNKKRVVDEVPASNRVDLGKTNIVQGTVSFNEKDVFKVEIPIPSGTNDPYDLLTVDGDYAIDYTNGYLYSRLTPRGYGKTYFYYRELPYSLVGTSCNVFSFGDSEFLDALYTQRPGKEYTPSHELLKYIRELYTVSNQTWGK